jgi:hypothetical protein
VTRSPASIPRACLAVATAFLAMSALALIVFPASLWLVGVPAAVRADGEPTRVWLGLNALLGFAVALLGGAVCRRLSPRKGALESLVGVCVCLGVVRALFCLFLPGGPEPGDDRVLVALSLVSAPSWSLWLDPALDLVGILCGGRLVEGTSTHGAAGGPP